MVPLDDYVTFVSDVAGQHEVRALISTQRGGEFEGTILVNVADRSSITSSDYSGIWDVIMNGVEGSLRIEQSEPIASRKFGGELTLENGLTLTIPERQGRWDGSSLTFRAYDEDGVRYHFESQKCSVDLVGTGWVFAHGDYLVGGKLVEIQKLEPLVPRFVEKCPEHGPYPHRDGAGSFFARAAQN